jgi:ubiquitin-protein ligase
MVNQRALRDIRLQNEYTELMGISGGVVLLEPIGDAPYDRYRVTFDLRTVIGPEPTFRERTVCLLTIPPGYPEIAPKIAVETSSMPQPWHPNWYKSGTWCFGHWSRDESLVNYLYRCAGTIQFRPEVTDPRPEAAANKDAVAFWIANQGRRGVIPADEKSLPHSNDDPPRIRF